MRQLAGLPCVICHKTVDSIVEGLFCEGCNGAVHNDCINPALAREAEGRCFICGADLRQQSAGFKRDEPEIPEHPGGYFALNHRGFGTSWVFARGDGVGGGDAVLCFVFAYMPVIPLQAAHLFDEKRGFLTGRQWQTVPLRQSPELLARVFCLYWMAFPFAAGLVAVVLSVWFGLINGFAAAHVYFMLGGLVPATLFGLGYYFLWRLDRRNRAIRKILGFHEHGSSDPATWAPEIVARAKTAQQMFATKTFAAAVPVLLEKGDRAGAMWAARLSTALEDQVTGEALTDQVLSQRLTVETQTPAN